MKIQQADQSKHEETLDELIAGYLAALEAGQPVACADLIAQHPDFAAEICQFIADQDRFDCAMAPLREVWAPQRSAPDPSSTVGLDAGGPAEGAVNARRRFGDYEILEEIARGGMGVVYKARQNGLNRLVALKMILAHNLSSANDVQRFRLEAEAAAGLDHPNIVPIFEIGEQAGQQFFSMKLIDGHSLAQEIGRFAADPGLRPGCC